MILPYKFYGRDMWEIYVSFFLSFCQLWVVKDSVTKNARRHGKMWQNWAESHSEKHAKKNKQTNKQTNKHTKTKNKNKNKTKQKHTHTKINKTKQNKQTNKQMSVIFLFLIFNLIFVKYDICSISILRKCYEKDKWQHIFSKLFKTVTMGVNPFYFFILYVTSYSKRYLKSAPTCVWFLETNQ